MIRALSQMILNVPLSFAMKMIVVGITMALGFKYSVALFVSHYHLMVDTQKEKCIPEHSTYLIVKNPIEIERGKIYTFSAKGMMPFFADNTLIGKYASGIEGDRISIGENGVLVNGQLVAEGYQLSEKLGIEPESLYKTFTVPKGKVFFTASASRSYDSRYWGLADQTQIIGEAIPLW